MRKTAASISKDSVQPIAVDIVTLQKMLDCGRVSAVATATAAGAVISIGRRKLYNVAKIRAYIDSVSE